MKEEEDDHERLTGASHYALEKRGGKPPPVPNVDGRTVMMGNIISDYGFGDEYWSSASTPGASPYAIVVEAGKEADDPPVRDVIIANNVVYDIGP